MKQKKLSLLLVLVFVFSLTFNVFAAENNLPAEPTIYGKSAITVDMQTGEVIYSKDIDTKKYPASTTKILTALLLAENKNKGDALNYTAGAKAQPEYSLNANLHSIDINETMSAENAMDGLLLYSGNDVAYMIADNVGKDATDFMNKMNEKVKSLGLKDTHFVTPNGLHDPNHYTTAYELSVISRKALENDWVRESMGKPKSTLKTSKGTILIVENRNKLLGKAGCIGGKTGYTSNSGRCLAAVFERNGRKILGVVMDSVYDINDDFVFNDMKKIVDWSYAKTPSTLHNKDSVIQTKSIKYKPLVFFGPEVNINVPIVIKEDINYFDNAVNKKELKEEIKLSNITVSSLKGNNSIGTLSIKERGTSKDYKLYGNVASGDILKASLPIYIGAAAALLAVVCVIGFIVKKILDIKRRRRRGKYI